MTPTLSPQQREEVLEAMFRVNHHPLAEPSSIELQKLGKALDAALPVIRRAVLEEAAAIAESAIAPPEKVAPKNERIAAASNYACRWIADRCRALAEEAR